VARINDCPASLMNEDIDDGLGFLAIFQRNERRTSQLQGRQIRSALHDVSSTPSDAAGVLICRPWSWLVRRSFPLEYRQKNQARRRCPRSIKDAGQSFMRPQRFHGRYDSMAQDTPFIFLLRRHKQGFRYSCRSRTKTSPGPSLVAAKDLGCRTGSSRFVLKTVETKPDGQAVHAC